MESLVENSVYADVVHLNNCNISTLTPEFQFSPFLAKLFLQERNSLTILPPSFFQHMPILLVLDLSHTSIQSLPPSISKLCSLEKFILRECSLLIELPPEIGALKNLKMFDLEGTEVMYLPKEIGKLGNLECLRVSLSAYADDHKDRSSIQHIIPRMTIMKLIKLQELSISVDPEAEWWEVELLEAIMGDLRFLPDLKTLKLYLPTAKALQQFLRLERCKIPIYSSLLNYRFMTGHCEQLPLSVQLDAEENFLKLEKCVKYMNGEGYTDEIMELIRDARALYLRRHWTIEKLSMYDLRRLKYCLLMECNEMQTLVGQEDFHKHEIKSTGHGEDDILGSLQYLSVHFLKKLQRISKGPIGRNTLSCLRILALHTCPELTCIFTESLLDNLQSLTEVIVEDCSKVNCLVNLEEGSPCRKGPFLRNLRRVSLLDLPELVSISGGVFIAPQLDTLLVFNCMKLDYLSDKEIPRDTMAIKGEIEWWDALKYGKLTWESVFVELKRDGSLMDQLAEDTNSLQHFLELEMVPSLPGQVNQNFSRDTKEDREHVDQLQIVHNVDLSNETWKMSTPKILNCYGDTQSQYAGTAFTMCEPLSPVSGKSDNEDTNCIFKDPNHKLASKKKNIRSTSIAKGTQQVKGDPHEMTNILQKSLKSKRRRRLRSFRRKVIVNKGTKIEKLLNDGYAWREYGQKPVRGFEYPRVYYKCSTYKGCPARMEAQRSTSDPSVYEVSYSGKHTCGSNKCSSAATESASVITDSHFELPKGPQMLDLNKKDYYRCSGFDANNLVQGSNDDTYKGMHTCLGLSVTSDSACECASILSISKNSDPSTTTEAEVRILKNSGPSTTSEAISAITDNSSGLNITKKMSSSTSIQRWKQQMEDIWPPFLKLQLASCYDPNKLVISEAMGNSSTNLPETSGTSTTTEAISTITDNSSGLNFTKKMSSRASIQRWKQQMEDIRPPSLELQLASSYEANVLSYEAFVANKLLISEAMGNSSKNLAETSGTSTTTEAISTITDNSSGLNFTKKMSSSASIPRWMQPPPSLEFQLASCCEAYEANRMVISEAAENSSRNLSSSIKTHQNAKMDPMQVPDSSTFLDFPVTNQTTIDFSSPTS